MAWEIRSNRRVYYRSRRVGRQVHRDYFSGMAAELAAALDQKRRRDRQADRDQVRALRQAWVNRCQPLDDFIQGVSLLNRAFLLAAGYLPRNEAPMDASNKLISAELLALMQRAESGEEAVLPELRRHLDAQPNIATTLGDLSKHAEEAWINQVAGSKLFLAETVRRQLQGWRTEVAGPDPTPIEKIMVDRAAACWLQVQYADMMFAQQIGAGVSPLVRRELERQRDHSHKRLLASLKQLMQMQKLSAPKKKRMQEFPRILRAAEAN